MYTLLFVLTFAAPAAPDDVDLEKPTIVAARQPTEKTVHHDLLNAKYRREKAGGSAKTRTHKERKRRSAKSRTARAKKRRSEVRLQNLLALDAESPLDRTHSQNQATAPIQTSDSKNHASLKKTKQREKSPLGLSDDNARPGAHRALPLAALENAEIGRALIPLFILAAFALFFTLVKKRRSGLEAVQVLESTTIGKGRQILVVEVAGQRLLLGSSEAGICVLKERVEMRAAAPQQNLEAAAFPPHPAIVAVRRLLGLQADTPAPVTASFESHLTCETSACSEDEELRRKLTARLSAV